MVSADMCEHRWPGSSCPECREEREKRKAEKTAIKQIDVCGFKCLAGPLENNFTREQRYIVIKRKHLTEQQEDEVRRLLAAEEIDTIECVVVESDWPEYETVWKMIEDRCAGRATLVEPAIEQAANPPRTHQAAPSPPAARP